MKRFLMLSGAWLLMTSVAFAQNYEAKFLAHQLSNTTPTGPSVSNSSTADFGFAAQPFGGITFAGTLKVTASPDVTTVAALQPATNTVVLNPPVQLNVSVSFTSTLPQLAGSMPDVFQKFTTELSGEVKVGSQQVCVFPVSVVPGRNPGTYTFTATMPCALPELFSSDVGRVPLPAQLDASVSAFFYYTARAEFGNRYSPSVAVFTFYRATQAGDLSVSVVDPNCESATSCDAEYLEEDPSASSQTTRLVQNLGALRTANVTRSATATDGVTMLLLRGSVPDTAPADTRVTFSLESSSGGTADAKWGVLLNRDGTGQGSSVTVPTEHVADGKRYAFALYRAPLDHPASTALNSTSVTIKAASSIKPAEIVSKSIKLVPPPVVLVHGVWSNRNAWALLEAELKKAGFRVCPDCRPDYGTYDPAPNFDPLERFSPESQYVLDVVLGGIRGALKEDRKNGIAVTQVDGVGHSMGGILLRARVATAMTGNDREYLRTDNYLKGDFHKIITVGSPHRGSTLVNWLIEHQCDVLQLRFAFNSTIGDYLADMGKPIKGGIYGFQTHSIPLRNLGRTRVPGHAIIGIAPPESRSEIALSVLVNTNLSRDPQGNKWNLDTIGGGEGKHDTIVNDLSQYGGIALPEQSTVIQGILHADVVKSDIDETESPAVWTRIEELLRDPIEKSFTFFQAYVPDPNDPIRGDCVQTQDSTRSITPALTSVITPAPGTIVKPGDTVVVTLSAPGAAPVDGAVFIAGDQADTLPGPGPFSYSFVVPAEKAGLLKIQMGTFGSNVELYGAETNVIVQPAQPPVSISATPSEVQLTRKEQFAQLIVTGDYADGSQLNLNASTAGTTYRTASGGTSVIGVTPEGLILANGNGSDTVIVTHAGKTTSVPVTVQFHVRRRVVRR